MTRHSISRRTFMQQSAIISGATVSGLSLWGTRQSRAGANDRVRVAVVGIRGHGKNHDRYYSQSQNIEVAALWSTGVGVVR